MCVRVSVYVLPAGAAEGGGGAAADAALPNPVQHLLMMQGLLPPPPHGAPYHQVYGAPPPNGAPFPVLQGGEITPASAPPHATPAQHWQQQPQQPEPLGPGLALPWQQAGFSRTGSQPGALMPATSGSTASSVPHHAAAGPLPVQHLYLNATLSRSLGLHSGTLPSPGQPAPALQPWAGAQGALPPPPSKQSSVPSSLMSPAAAGGHADGAQPQAPWAAGGGGARLPPHPLVGEDAAPAGTAPQVVDGEVISVAPSTRMAQTSQSLVSAVAAFAASLAEGSEPSGAGGREREAQGRLLGTPFAVLSTIAEAESRPQSRPQSGMHIELHDGEAGHLLHLDLDPVIEADSVSLAGRSITPERTSAVSRR